MHFQKQAGSPALHGSCENLYHKEPPGGSAVDRKIACCNPGNASSPLMQGTLVYAWLLVYHNRQTEIMS